MTAVTNEVIRRLARDQWVRLHGTPRVTVLVGADARAVYMAWLELGRTRSTLHEGDDLERLIRAACTQASARPTDTVAVCTTRSVLNAWRAGRTDRLAAMVDEGLLEISDSSAATPRLPGILLDARSAAEAAMFEALGILLATQNPGDFDYKARDNIATWLVGKVAQDRAIEKMRNLIGQYPNVGPRLATQPTGHFFVLTAGRATEVRCDRSLMQTEQLSETEVSDLARLPQRSHIKP